MPVFSRITVEFLVDFELDYQCTFFINDNGTNANQQFTWVASRSAGFEVTVGTPTATAGERTATNLEAAFDLDNPTGYVSTQTTNTLVIESETSGEDFWGFKATDENDVLLIQGSDYNVTFENFEQPFTQQNAQQILTRSPHYVTTPFRFLTTTAVDIDIYIWDGLIASQPASPQVQINRVRPTVDFADLNTNISDIVDAYIDEVPQIVTASTAQLIDSNTNAVKWVRYESTYTDPQNDVAPVNGNFAAMAGYGYFLEEVNPQLPNQYLSSSALRKIDRNGYILLPFINNDTYTQVVVASTPSSQVNSTLTITSSTESTDYVQYLGIDVSALSSDTAITCTFTKTAGGTDVVTYNIEDECVYTPKTFLFKNKYGYYDTVSMTKKSYESMTVDKSQFVNNYVTAGTYATTKHQYKDINITVEEELRCNSGIINESENELYKELLQSDTVYLLNGSDLIPVRVKTSNLEYKTRVNDGVKVQYEINFEYAYSKINNI